MKRVLVLALVLSLFGVARADAGVTNSRLVKSIVSTAPISLGNGTTLQIMRWHEYAYGGQVQLEFQGPDAPEGELAWQPSRYSFDYREPWRAHVAFRTVLPKRGLVAADLYWISTGRPQVTPDIYMTYSGIRPLVIGANATRPALVRGEIVVNGRTIPVNVRGEMFAASPYY